ncbi:hypothetical protein FJU08_18970 [Martelella alba]|uniref:Uncharacterized protein n=1 Tax=Martelella alba TaxID=2590451 RepID=A0A506U0E7_9HYPH|nr:hypothetical protein [Martelella alba]TPW27813.1 hypothetical protein FJU08_18970 [Martelella alba]
MKQQRLADVCGMARPEILICALPDFHVSDTDQPELLSYTVISRIDFVVLVIKVNLHLGDPATRSAHSNRQVFVQIA